MTKFTNPLSSLKIASPCSADWNEMMGNERKRFCGECKLNVYNLSGMSQREAENLLINSEGRLCVRFFKRADGTMLTKDCPVGWQAIRQHVSKTATAFASIIFAVISGIGLTNYFTKSEPQITSVVLPKVKNLEVLEVDEITIEELNSNVAVQEIPIATMGRVSIENMPTIGMAYNVEEVKQQLRKKRKR